MNKIKCPNAKCQGNERHLRYVQKVYEYFSLATMPDENGCVELESLKDSYVDEEFSSYLTCNKCGHDFKLNGEKLYNYRG